MMSREEWLEEKRHYIGSSDVAAILGEDPHKPAIQVYASKVHGYTQDDKDALIYGRYVEAAIAKMYRHKTKRQIFDYGATALQRHAHYDFIASTLDNVTKGSKEYPGIDDLDGTAPLEIKSSGGFVWRDDKWRKTSPHEWAANPPTHNLIQNQIQMACTGSLWGSLACLFSPAHELTWHDHKVNELFLKAVYPILEEFWDNVKKRRPPKIDDMPRSLDIVKHMYPEDTGKTVILNKETSKLVGKWLKIKDSYSDLKKTKKILEAKIRGVIKDATFGQLPDGKFVTLKTTHTRGYTKVVEPNSYRVLRYANNK